jgi:hypothetical protein
MATKTEQMSAALEEIIGRKLQDEEISGIEIWSKSFDLAHFIEGFPQQWSLFKEMLQAYLKDFEEQWDGVKGKDPKDCGDLAVIHAQVYGANRVVRAFIEDVESSPERMREVPEIVKQNASALRSVPA